MSVRCFKNVSSKPIVYELSWWVQTSNQTSTVVWWNEGEWKTLTIPTKTGFIFDWWYLTSWYEEWTRVTKNVISDYSDNESVTLYAKWKDPQYKTITYNANGWYFSWWLVSTGIVYKEETTSWNYITLSNVQFPNREWYMFDGWYLTWWETEWTWYVDNSTEEQTVYAKWDFVCESGKWYHIGENDKDKICLYADKKTSPAIAIANANEDTYYISLSSDSELKINKDSDIKMHVLIGDQTYNAYDESVNQ